MRFETFLDTVQQAAGITREQAQRAVQATLSTLADRITRGEYDDLVPFLPRELRQAVTAGPEPAERFGLEEFVRRVSTLEGVDERTAYRHVEAVFRALGQAVPAPELNDLASQLSRDFEPMLEAARSADHQPPPQDLLVTRVAELASLDPGSARQAVEAVLETLAVRISDGEVDDLRRKLPGDWRAALDRGLAQSRKATRMSLSEFLDSVARREGTDRDEAERHARAVFAALRELVSDKEIYDVESELPREYAELFSGVV